MKKILITIMLSMFFVGLYSTSAFASSEYEHKYWAVTGEYVRYGHLIINGTDFQVYMTLIDNGTSMRFVPLIYSTELQTITLTEKGDHTIGKTLDEAKRLSDYYNNNIPLLSLSLENLSNEQVGYLYYVHPNFSLLEYHNTRYKEFYTELPKYYYFEEGCDLNSTDTYIRALNQILFGGGLGDFTITDGNISKVSTYTLEPPLNIQVSNFQSKKFSITWEQSEDINTTGWYTEFYIQQIGTYKKTFFAAKKNFDTDFLFYDKTLNHYKKFTFNAMNLKTTDEYLINLLNNNGYEPQEVIYDKTNIMMRNVFDDGKGNVSYSNYVYLYQDDNYEYIANEVDAEILDSKGMNGVNIDDSVKTDSEYYDNSNINGIISTDMNSGNAVSIMRGLLNSVKEFPQFVYEFYCYLPEEISIAISAFLLLLIPIALIKIVV